MSQYTAQELAQEHARLRQIPLTPEHLVLAGHPISDDELLRRAFDIIEEPYGENGERRFICGVRPDTWDEHSLWLQNDMRRILGVPNPNSDAEAARQAELDAIYARNVRNSRRWEWIQSAAILFAIGSN